MKLINNSIVEETVIVKRVREHTENTVDYRQVYRNREGEVVIRVDYTPTPNEKSAGAIGQSVTITLDDPNFNKKLLELLTNPESL